MEGDIQIPLPGSSNWPVSRVKKWINIITTGAALIIGSAALIRPSDDVAAHRETLKQLQIQQNEIIQLHQSIMDCEHHIIYVRDSANAPDIDGHNPVISK